MSLAIQTANYMIQRRLLMRNLLTNASINFDAIPYYLGCHSLLFGIISHINKENRIK